MSFLMGLVLGKDRYPTRTHGSPIPKAASIVYSYILQIFKPYST